MGFVTRNLKRKGVRIGVFLIIIGICSGVFAYCNAKPNINGITYEDIPVVAEQIDGIGEETLKSVVDNQPYEDMEELKQVPNVGEKRYKILKKHFDTRDICRIGYFWLSVFVAIVCVAFGANWIVWVISKQHANTGEMMKNIVSAVKASGKGRSDESRGNFRKTD